MSASQGVMRIGEVHAELRKDYPDIELSKIRYYEDKGLVQPSRSRKGYRLYSERDVDCLREAIRLAQEEFVPLRVVRLRLIEQGLLMDSPPASSPRQAAREATVNVVSIAAPRPALSVVAQAAPTSGDQRYFTTSEFFTETGLEATAINQLQSLGLIAPVTIDTETAYSDLDVRVAVVAGALLARDVDLRLLGPLRRIAQREIGLVDDLTMPLRGRGSGLSNEQVGAVTAEVAGEVATLRAALYERELQGYLEH